MFTLITAPLAALFSENDNRSEMVSQLLFGEQIEILEKEGSWYFVKNLNDDCSGWIHKSGINQKQFTETAADTSGFSAIRSALMTCFKTSSVEKITLPGGSLTPPLQNEQFEMQGEIYQVAQFIPAGKKRNDGLGVVELAQQYVNSPYLRGGKSLFGIDSSGLVQLTYSMAGVSLPRYASKQVELGSVVDFLTEAEPGDLAFFSNEEGEVIHTGILLNSHQIIHVSGITKIEIIDAQGIISSETGEYSHHLRVVKRLF